VTLHRRQHFAQANWKNQFENVPFARAFSNPIWNEYLSSLRTNIIATPKTAEEIHALTDSSDAASYGEGINEEEFWAEYLDNLLASGEFPELNPHPGLLLCAFLGEIDHEIFAEWLGFPKGIVSRVLAGEARVSSVLAGRLSERLGTHPTFWTNLQQKHDRQRQSGHVPDEE